MKISIKKQIEVIINVDFPFYYKHDLNDDYDQESNCIYGVVLEEHTISVHESINGGEVSYEIEFEKPARLSGMGKYFKDFSHKSSKIEFEQAIRRAKDFINKSFPEIKDGKYENH